MWINYIFKVTLFSNDQITNYLDVSLSQQVSELNSSTQKFNDKFKLPSGMEIPASNGEKLKFRKLTFNTATLRGLQYLTTSQWDWCNIN